MVYSLKQEEAEHTALGSFSVQHYSGRDLATNPNCLFVNKSNIELECVRPRVLTLSIGIVGEIVLNTGLKSANSILTHVLLFSRCVRAEWRAVEMAFCVDLLALYANWSRLAEMLY